MCFLGCPSTLRPPPVLYSGAARRNYTPALYPGAAPAVYPGAAPPHCTLTLLRHRTSTLYRGTVPRHCTAALYRSTTGTAPRHCTAALDRGTGPRHCTATLYRRTVPRHPRSMTLRADGLSVAASMVVEQSSFASPAALYHYCLFHAEDIGPSNGCRGHRSI